ncbi:MAG: glycosyltransferase [Chloroflexi bacterium]|nr:glycosyltransferase [Chloroflexota bacterium]
MLQVISDLDVGGGQEVVRTLSRYLPEVGCLPVVVTLRDGPLRADLERMGVTVEVVQGRTRSLASLPAAIGELLRLRRDLVAIVARHRSEIIQTHLLRALDFLILTLRQEPTVRRVFWTFHNARLDLRSDQVSAQRWLLGPKRLVYRLLYRAGARHVDGMIAVSDDVAEAVRSSFRPPTGKLLTIANGVDLERYGRPVDRSAVLDRVGIPSEARVLIVVAKLMPQKGHAILLRALAPLLKRFPDLHVLIVGDGPLRESLIATIERLPAPQRIRLVGNRLDVNDLLAASDLFVLPSLWEGLPMALLEAMASGLPVVATKVSGSSQVVVDNKTGFLVPPGDVNRLAAAIATMLGDPERARLMAEAGLERVRRLYSGRAQAARHAEIYGA